MSIATRTPDDVRPTDPDADLVDALRRRDERALMTLVRRHSPTMLRVARGYVGPELAEDVVQETWIAVLRGIDGFSHRALFKTWLMRILVNAACSRRAKERRAVFWSPLCEDVPAEDAFDPGPEQRAMAGDLWSAVRAALDELPERQRTVVVLRDVEGWTAEEVSAALSHDRVLAPDRAASNEALEPDCALRYPSDCGSPDGKKNLTGREGFPTCTGMSVTERP
jgi:RNA polymerase sigma-70 factor, ECF subfamily